MRDADDMGDVVLQNYMKLAEVIFGDVGKRFTAYQSEYLKDKEKSKVRNRRAYLVMKSDPEKYKKRLERKALAKRLKRMKQ